LKAAGEWKRGPVSARSGRRIIPTFNARHNRQ
jgi:hypothetical protein